MLVHYGAQPETHQTGNASTITERGSSVQEFPNFCVVIEITEPLPENTMKRQHDRISKALRHAQTSLFVIWRLGTEKRSLSKKSLKPEARDQCPLVALGPVEGLKHHLLLTPGWELPWPQFRQASLLRHPMYPHMHLVNTNYSVHNLHSATGHSLIRTYRAAHACFVIGPSSLVANHYSTTLLTGRRRPATQR